MRNKELFDKEIILLECDFTDNDPSDDVRLCAEIEATMLKIISENEYLAGRSNRKKQIFHKLAAVCVTLTQHAKGEISVCLYPNADEALIFITAPELLFSGVLLGKLYNIVIGASNIIIDTVKDTGDVCVTVSFSFEDDSSSIVSALDKL